MVIGSLRKGTAMARKREAAQKGIDARGPVRYELLPAHVPVHAKDSWDSTRRGSPHGGVISVLGLERGVGTGSRRLLERGLLLLGQGRLLSHVGVLLGRSSGLRLVEGVLRVLPRLRGVISPRLEIALCGRKLLGRLQQL